MASGASNEGKYTYDNFNVIQTFCHIFKSAHKLLAFEHFQRYVIAFVDKKFAIVGNA